MAYLMKDDELKIKKEKRKKKTSVGFGSLKG